MAGNRKNKEREGERGEGVTKDKRKRGERQGEGVQRKRERVEELWSHLFKGAEDVGIILLEASNSCESRESTRDLVTMEHSKVSHPQRQLPP